MDLLIALFPTLIFVLIVVYQILRGFMRGQRKSIYLFINMIIAMVISIVLFFVWTYVGGLDMVMDSSGLDDTVSGSVSFVLGDKTFDVALAYASLIINFVVLIVIQLFVYPTVKAVLYIIYFFIFRGKVVEDKECGDTKRIGGMLIGALRGIVVGFLVFSQFSTLYFIVSGGVFYTSEEYDTLDIPFSAIPGIGEENSDLINELYKGIKTSRSNGLGVAFEKLSIGDTSLDYLFLDLAISGSYENFKGDKTTVTVREELGNLLGIFTTAFETGLIQFDENSEFVPNFEVLQNEKVLATLSNSIQNTNLFVDGIPTVLIDFIESNPDTLGMTIDTDLLKNLDIKNDVEVICGVLGTFFSMVSFENGYNFDNIDFYDLDAESVDKIIIALSELTFMVDVLLPLGVNFVSAAAEDLVFDLDGIIWKNELQNLEGLYQLFLDLELTEGFSSLLPDLEAALADNDAEKIATLDKIVEQVFNSDLVHSLTVGVMEMTVKQMATNPDSIQLDVNTENYLKSHLKEDVSLLLDTVVGGYSIYQQVTAEGFFETGLNDLDVEGLRLMVLGDDVDQKGVMDLNFISICLNEDQFFTVMFESLAGDVVEIPAGLVWRAELHSMFDVISTIQQSNIDLNALMGGDLNALSQISKTDSDKLTTSICDSVLMTTFFVSTLVGDGTEGGLSFLEIPNGLDWYGDDSSDGEIKYLLDAIFCVVRMDGVIDSLTNGDFSAVLNACTAEDVDLLLSSQVLAATISVQITALSTDGLLTIPTDCIVDGYITQAELKKLVNSIIALNLDISDFDINVILADGVDYDVVLSSDIIVATISKLLIDVEILEIPEDCITDGIIDKTELVNLLNSLRELGLDFDNVSMDSLFADDIDYNQVFESKILSASISTILIDTNVLEIPTDCIVGGYIQTTELVDLMVALRTLGFTEFENFDISKIFEADENIIFGSKILSATVSAQVTSANVFTINSDLLDSEGYITEVELKALFAGLKALNITAFDNIDLTSILENCDDFNTVLNSQILHETFSEILTDAMDIPLTYYTDGTSTVEVVTNGVVSKTEITNYIAAIKVLGLGVNGEISSTHLSGLSADDKTTLTDSYIICSVLSDLITFNGTKHNVTTTGDITIYIVDVTTIKSLL